MEWTGKRIEAMRKEYKLTLKMLGTLVGVSGPTVYRWEKGGWTPSKTTQLLLTRIEEDLKRKEG